MSSDRKLEAAKPALFPVDPFESLPRIPRAPSAPSERPTDPAPPPDDDEKTPLDSPYSLRKVSQKLDTVLALIEKLTDEVMASRSEMREIRAEQRSIIAQIAVVKATQNWVPLVLSSVALVVALWSAFHR